MNKFRSRNPSQSKNLAEFDCAEFKKWTLSGVLLIFLVFVSVVLLYLTQFSDNHPSVAPQNSKILLLSRAPSFSPNELASLSHKESSPQIETRKDVVSITDRKEFPLNNSASLSDLTEEVNAENPRAKDIDPTLAAWTKRFWHKLGCMKVHRVAFYLYHVRKAAGTTVREMMRLIAFRQKIPFYETEGIVLNRKLLEREELFSIITLRDPINRIISLYWYEHVGWFFGILKQPQRCKPLRDWIRTWRDGSSHKAAILRKLPSNNYVEIENYYTKLLIGLNYQEKQKRELTREDLSKAKEILRRFDLVLITEWINDESENNLLHSLFRRFYHSETREVIIPQKVKGDAKMKEKLSPVLAPDEVSEPLLPFIRSDLPLSSQSELRKQLIAMNAFDIELYQYAKDLVALRLKQLSPLSRDSPEEEEKGAAETCSPLPMAFLSQQRQNFGVFQPPGHKGP